MLVRKPVSSSRISTRMSSLTISCPQRTTQPPSLLMLCTSTSLSQMVLPEIHLIFWGDEQLEHVQLSKPLWASLSVKRKEDLVEHDLPGLSEMSALGSCLQQYAPNYLDTILQIYSEDIPFPWQQPTGPECILTTIYHVNQWSQAVCLPVIPVLFLLVLLLHCTFQRCCLLIKFLGVIKIIITIMLMIHISN